MADALSADEVKAWLDANQDKAGTADFVQMTQAHKELTGAPPLGASGTPSPPISTDNSGLPPVAAPAANLRTGWANEQERATRDQGGILGALRSINDIPRAAVQGTAVGQWGDRINAYLASLGLPFGGGPGFTGGAGTRTYEEELALQQARNRRSDTEHPIRNTVAGLGGAAGSAFATGGVGWGTSALSRAGPQIVLDTASAASRGASMAPEGGGSSAATTDAATTLPPSALLNLISHNMGKYSQLSPLVVEAARRLGVDLPFFARAANPDVQAAGRRYAQTHQASGLNRDWNAGSTGVVNAAERTALPGTGSVNAAVAPYDAGSQLHPGLQASIDAAQAEKGRLSQDIANLLPPGERYDVPGMRATTNAMVAERRGIEATNPRAGLEEQIAFSTRPRPAPYMGPWGQGTTGGSSWDEISGHATGIGQRLGEPPNIPRAVDDARLGEVYRSLRQDQRDIMRNTSGLLAEEAFTGNVERQRVLSETQRQINAAMKDRPEAVINLAHNAASTSGAGTDINTLHTMVTALDPAQRMTLGSGVLAKIVNDSNGSPQRIASALEAMPDETRNLLFTPGSTLAAQVEDLRTVAGRVGDVNAMQGTGSAASLGNKMVAGMGYGGAGATATGLTQYLTSSPGLAAAVGAAVGGLPPMYQNAIKPYLLQHGMPGGVKEAIDAAMRGGVRVGAPAAREALLPGMRIPLPGRQ